MRTRLAVAGAVGLLILSVSSASTLGDGGYMPETAFAALPSIPHQQAIIVYRNGEETLIVESAFESESPEVGWILPLPAEPTEIEVAEPGMLTTMAVCLGPDVIHDLGELMWWGVTALVFLFPLACKAVFFAEGLRWWEVVLWFLVFAMFMPALGTAGGGGAPTAGMEVLSTERIGAYNVSVLRAEEPGALDAWLAQEGLKPLTPQGKTIAAGYIKDDWCFVVARLVREEGGAATPHPLSVTFPVEEPVYPMRMTAIAGSTTRVQLYIVAEQMASAEGFRMICADRYAAWSMNSDEDWQQFALRLGGPYMGPGDILRAGAEGRYYARFYPDGLQAYVGMATRTAFGQPAVTALLWDGCVVTRLDADLTPEEMQEDVRLDLRPLEAQQERVFSSRGRWHAVGNVLVWGGVALLVCVVVTCNKRRRPGRVGRRWLAGILAVTLLGSVGVALSHRTVEVGPSLGFWEPFHRQDALSTAAACMAHDGYLHEGMTAEQFADLPQMMADRDYLTPEMFVNPFTGGRVRYERSPGNFFVRTFEGGEWLYVYDRRGIEIPVLELPPPPLRERVPDEAGPQDSLPQ